MTDSNIFFSEEEKTNLLKIAVALAKQLEKDREFSEDIARLSHYPPLVNAIELAKLRKLDSPSAISNMNYWIFETDLGNQRDKFVRLSEMLSKFLLAVEGFPYEEIKDDDCKKET